MLQAIELVKHCTEVGRWGRRTRLRPAGPSLLAAQASQPCWPGLPPAVLIVSNWRCWYDAPQTPAAVLPQYPYPD